MVTVSVIIPTMNEAQRIGGCIESAARADEIIIADGGSNDGTPEIARSMQAHVVASKTGRGIQQNTGASFATSDVLLFLHADNRLSQDCITQIRKLAASSESIAGAFKQRIDTRGLKYRLLEWGNLFRAKRRRLPFGDQGIFISRTLFNALGGFRDVPFLEDVILMKAISNDQEISVLPGPIIVDARRWKRNGVIRQTLINRSILKRFGKGASPDELIAEYRRDDQQRTGD